MDRDEETRREYKPAGNVFIRRSRQRQKIDKIPFRSLLSFCRTNGRDVGVKCEKRENLV